MLRSQKNYISRLQESLKSYLASTSSIGSGTTNLHCLIGERLECYLLSNHCQSLRTQICPNQWHGSGSHLTASRSFTNAFDILDVIFLPTKAFVTSHLLWHRYCCCLRIKNLIPATYSLCKYI